MIYIWQSLLTSVNKILANLSNLIQTGYKSNAFAPWVWFTGVASAVLLPLTLVTKNEMITTIVVLAVVGMIIYGMIMYAVLLKKDPKLLQSESYRLEDKKLDIISEKGKGLAIRPVDILLKEIDSTTRKIDVQ